MWLSSSYHLQIPLMKRLYSLFGRYHSQSRIRATFTHHGLEHYGGTSRNGIDMGIHHSPILAGTFNDPAP
jgi:hypothetical protein